MLSDRHLSNDFAIENGECIDESGNAIPIHFFRQTSLGLLP
jgi:hypothetical protein